MRREALAPRGRDSQLRAINRRSGAAFAGRRGRAGRATPRSIPSRIRWQLPQVMTRAARWISMHCCAGMSTRQPRHRVPRTRTTAGRRRVAIFSYCSISLASLSAITRARAARRRASSASSCCSRASSAWASTSRRVAVSRPATSRPSAGGARRLDRIHPLEQPRLAFRDGALRALDLVQQRGVGVVRLDLELLALERFAQRLLILQLALDTALRGLGLLEGIARARALPPPPPRVPPASRARRAGQPAVLLLARPQLVVTGLQLGEPLERLEHRGLHVGDDRGAGLGAGGGTASAPGSSLIRSTDRALRRRERLVARGRAGGCVQENSTRRPRVSNPGMRRAPILAQAGADPRIPLPRSARRHGHPAPGTSTRTVSTHALRRRSHSAGSMPSDVST